MPELPEVECLKNSLYKSLINNSISEIEFFRSSLRYPLDPIITTLTDLKILSLSRRARYLIINLANYQSLIIHLGMSGRLILANYSVLPQKHDHVIIYLASKEKLIFNDPRRFGMIYFLPSTTLLTSPIFNNLGVEPLSKEFNGKYFYSKIKHLNRSIKNVLMTNEIVVGIGNIYAAESLFLSGIHPAKFCSELNLKLINILVQNIKVTLEKAITYGGTSIRDYVNGQSKKGNFANELVIYNRLGKNCLICGTTIQTVRISGRASNFCVNCQKI